VAVASNLVHGSNEARRGKLGCAVANYQEEPIEVLGHGGGALAWSLVRTNDGCEFRVIYETWNGAPVARRRTAGAPVRGLALARCSF